VLHYGCGDQSQQGCGSPPPQRGGGRWLRLFCCVAPVKPEGPGRAELQTPPERQQPVSTSFVCSLLVGSDPPVHLVTCHVTCRVLTGTGVRQRQPTTERVTKTTRNPERIRRTEPNGTIRSNSSHLTSRETPQTGARQRQPTTERVTKRARNQQEEPNGSAERNRFDTGQVMGREMTGTGARLRQPTTHKEAVNWLLPLWGGILY
jgi:hypothetical protein